MQAHARHISHTAPIQRYRKEGHGTSRSDNKTAPLSEMERGAVSVRCLMASIGRELV